MVISYGTMSVKLPSWVEAAERVQRYDGGLTYSLDTFGMGKSRLSFSPPPDFWVASGPKGWAGEVEGMGTVAKPYQTWMVVH